MGIQQKLVDLGLSGKNGAGLVICGQCHRQKIISD